MASIWDYVKTAKDYYNEYKGLVDAAGSAGKAYLDYKDQKRRNELDEQAYRDYMLEKESAGQEAQSAVDINLTPMEITGVPTSKADVTSFQKVARGGIIGLKNGGDPNAGITALREKAPGVVKAMGFNMGGGPGIEALRKKAPDVVKRMGFDEGSPDTVMFGMDGGGDLAFPKIEGKSEEYAILSGLFNDVDGKVDDETKMSYYKTLIPYVYKNGDISKKEYEAMIQEVIETKAKGGIIGLRKKYGTGSDPYEDDPYEGMSVMEILIEEGYPTANEAEFEEEFGTLGSKNKTDGTVKIEDAVKMAGYEPGVPTTGDLYDMNNPDYNGINPKIIREFIDEGIPLGYTSPEEYFDDFYGPFAKKNKNSNIEDRNKDSAEMFKIIKGAAKGGIINLKKGGRVKRAAGGVMDLGGREKDYRFNGGFVPIGEYEKKDDVPARLSKNEFVFTADAVRAAGGGSINKGAQKMYDTMKTLEAQPTAKRMTA